MHNEILGRCEPNFNMKFIGESYPCYTHSLKTIPVIFLITLFMKFL